MHPSTRVRFADAHVAPLEGDGYSAQNLLPPLLRPARACEAHGLCLGLTFAAGALWSFEEDRPCRKQHKRKQEKQMGQRVHVRPLHDCHEQNGPSARPVKRECSDDATNAGAPNAPLDATAPDAPRVRNTCCIAHGYATMHAVRERQVYNPCMGDGKWECRKQGRLSWSTTSPRSGRPSLTP